MRTRAALFFTFFPFLISILGGHAWAASSASSTDPGLATFRITTGEVHVAISAVTRRNQAVTELTTNDFVLLRDGEPVREIVSFGKHQQSPFSALVLTDVSESMQPGLALERDAAQWLRVNSDPTRDELIFLDFGLQVEPTNHQTGTHLTSLYDSLIQTLPRVATLGPGRRALILLSDGDDNTSYHALSEVIGMAQKFDVAIYAVTAHPSRKQYVSEDVLQKMTTETGGKFYQVRKPRDMEAALLAIRAELTNGYELVFRPDSANAGMHQLTVHSLDGRLKFCYRTAYFQPEGSRIQVAIQ